MMHSMYLRKEWRIETPVEEAGCVLGVERWEEGSKVKLTFLRWQQASGWGLVNDLGCTAIATSPWPRAGRWHATDTRQNPTLTPQMITFSLWKLATRSHSSHSVSVSLPLRSHWRTGGRLVLTLKSNYLSFIRLFLPSEPIRSEKVKQLSFSQIKSKVWSGPALSEYGALSESWTTVKKGGL